MRLLTKLWASALIGDVNSYRIAASTGSVDLVDDHTCWPALCAEPRTSVDGILDPSRYRRGIAVVTGVDLKRAIARLLCNDVRERRLAISWWAREEKDLSSADFPFHLAEHTRSRGRPSASW